MDEKMREMKEELTETRKDRDALRERLRLSASMDQAQKIALIRALQECASVLGLDDPSPAVLVESITALHARTRTEANPWRYVERDGNPTEEGAYTVALKFQDATAVSQDVWQETFWLYHRDPRIPIYAYRLPPEPPPLEPEGDDQ